MPTVLVVDDSAVDRRLVAGLLENANHWKVELAESAEQALQQLAQSPAEVVLTDLRMPGMDGLDLLRAIRVQYADLPVVLMTAQGSEDLAVEALRQGAAGYVPKSQLATLLVETLDNVLGMVRADRAHGELIKCLARNEFSFHLPNDPSLIGPVVDLVQQMVAAVGLCDATGRVRVAIALEQALLDGMFRGNLELTADDALAGDVALLEQRRTQPPYCDRKLTVEVQIVPEQARFVVRDEGPGFDTSVLQNGDRLAALERNEGRGLVLMRSFMDEVHYNERGNEVTLLKRREAIPQPEALPTALLQATSPTTPAEAEPTRPLRWGEVPSGSRVTDSISGRAFRVYRREDSVTLSSPGGDTVSFAFDDPIDPVKYRVYVL